MKLEEIARRAIDLIREEGNGGITTAELATRLGVPKRRIYDVKAIMVAANLIETSRDKNGTNMVWNEDGPAKINKIDAKKIKVRTKGLIKSVSNSSHEVIIECSEPGIKIETLQRKS